MAYFIFVDNSNVWIEGKYAAAVHKGLAANMIEAHSKNLSDNSWRIDFGKLLNFCCNSEQAKVASAIAIGSKPPANDSLWNSMMTAQFEVVKLERNAANKEKSVDTAIVQRIDKALYKKAQHGDTFVLVVGDGDYIPSVEAIREEGMQAIIVFWSNVSGELIANASNFIELDSHIDEITWSVP